MQIYPNCGIEPIEMNGDDQIMYSLSSMIWNGQYTKGHLHSLWISLIGNPRRGAEITSGQTRLSSNGIRDEII